MTQKENTGMSIMGLLQDAPSTARTFVIDKGQSGDDFRRSICEAMRCHPVVIGEMRDPLTTEQIKSALIAQDSCLGTTREGMTAQENPHP
jgi:hypothetical protein